MVKYRSDIDGLRAVAVLPVILFHIGSPLFPGGYVGVDVFFVISGFLITATLKQEIEAGDFSIVRFYERRARRILPALFAMVAFALVAGLFILMPDDLKDLGSSAAATALFASNFLFWHQTDYFAPGAEIQPLIHTWSLAVEEQYYIFFPLFLAALGRWGGRRFILPTLLVALVSLAISIVGVHLASPGAYYLLPSRAWELLAGSLLALGAFPAVRSVAAREVLAGTGLMAILLSATLLTSESPFPGLLALPSVLGSMAIIHAGSSGPTLTGRALSLRVMVGVGLISYSLYLWHWPLIVYARYAAFGELSTTAAVMVLATTFVAAYLSWRFVERPFRNRARITQRPLFIASAAAIALATLTGAGLYGARGLPQRFPEVAAMAAKIKAERKAGEGSRCVLNSKVREWAGPEKCTLTHGKGTAILFWGDSHALHYQRALRQLDGKVAGRVMIYGMTACTPILDRDIPSVPLCRAHNDRVLELVKAHGIKRVILSALWQSRDDIYDDGPGTLPATIRKLEAAGAEVAIISDNPLFYFSEPTSLAARASRMADPRAALYMPVKNDRRVPQRLAKLVKPALFLDPLPLLCKETQCVAMEDGQLMMTDGSHLSLYGANRVIAAMAPLLN